MCKNNNDNFNTDEYIKQKNRELKKYEKQQKAEKRKECLVMKRNKFFK